MRAMVIYESIFGNTAAIAHAIAAGMAPGADVEVFFFDELELFPDDLDLLVVGGPTRAHGLHTPLADYLDRLPEEQVDGVRVAAFDTRLNWPRFLSGSAAASIAGRLERKGAHNVVRPQSFLIEDRDGPLLEGELDRAEKWGHELVLAVRSPV